jgi:hypothetical protein
MLHQLVREFVELPWIYQFTITIVGLAVLAVAIGSIVDKFGSWNEQRRWAKRWRW